MSESILLARELPETAMNALAAWPSVDIHKGETGLTKEQLIARLQGKAALICQLTQRVDEDVLSVPGLKVVANVAVGYDNIDVSAATRHGVRITNTPGILDDTTADFAWAMLMGIARRLREGERLVRTGEWKGWDLLQLLGTDVHHKTLGIIGFGNIGRRMARRAKGFDMKVLYTGARRAPTDVERDLNAEHVPMEDLLNRSDFVSLHVPLLPATTRLIGRTEFAMMKPEAFLINTARGPVVDEGALVTALESGQIAGAALDVFEKEPKIHPGLLDRDDVLLAPHIASASIETRTKMAMMAVENVISVLKGNPAPNLVNREMDERD